MSLIQENTLNIMVSLSFLKLFSTKYFELDLCVHHHEWHAYLFLCQMFIAWLRAVMGMNTEELSL